MQRRHLLRRDNSLDNMIKNSQATLARQIETVNWMKTEIDKNHLPVLQVKTDNPRSVVENSAHEINLTLTDIRQDGQTLAFVVNRVNVYELKNWLREMNLASGVRLEKMNLTPVDHLSDVKAEIQLTWKKWHERADTRPGELSRRVCRDERRVRRDPGEFSRRCGGSRAGDGARGGEPQQPAFPGVTLSRLPACSARMGEHPAAELAGAAGTLSLLQVADSAAVIFTRAVDGGVLWPHRPVDTGLSIPFLAVGAGGLSAAAGDD
jgi:general secretion pathway protein M